MGLVDNDRVVVAQQAITLDLVEQYAIGHELHGGVLRDGIVKADFVADQGSIVADLLVEFLRDALGHAAGRDAARLGVTNDLGASAAEFQAHLGNLGGFTRAGLTGDDDHLVVLDGLFDVFSPLRDRQVGVGNRRNGADELRAAALV